MVTNTDLYDRYEEADSYAQEPVLKGEGEFQKRFSAIERKLEKLWFRDTAEWVAEFYREAYRDRQDEERDDPLCRCPNPRCPLKQGQVPYQLRRRETTLITPERTPMDVLKAFLKTHPGAVIIDEALQHLRDVRATVSDDLVKYNTDARSIMEAEYGEGYDNVPMSQGIKSEPELTSPPGESA